MDILPFCIVAVDIMASAYILLRWIQTKRAVVNAVLAGMHHIDVNADRMGQDVEHMGKYDFSSLRFPVPLSSVGSFASTNNISINVYGTDDDKEAIYPLRVSSTPVPDRLVDLLLFGRGGVQHYTT